MLTLVLPLLVACDPERACRCGEHEEDGDTGGQGEVTHWVDTAETGGCPDGEVCEVSAAELETTLYLTAYSHYDRSRAAGSGATVAMTDGCDLFVFDEAPTRWTPFTSASLAHYERESDDTYCQKDLYGMGNAGRYGSVIYFLDEATGGIEGSFQVYDHAEGDVIARLPYRSWISDAWSADYDGDGAAELVLADGDTNEYTGIVDLGVVNVYDGNARGDLGEADLVAAIEPTGAFSAGGEDCDYLGHEVDLWRVDDVDGDGVADLGLHGSCGDDNELVTLFWSGLPTGGEPAASADAAGLGMRVSNAADWDGDGSSDLAVVESSDAGCSVHVIPAPGGSSLDPAAALFSVAADETTCLSPVAYLSPVGDPALGAELVFEVTAAFEGAVGYAAYLPSLTSREGSVELAGDTPRLVQEFGESSARRTLVPGTVMPSADGPELGYLVAFADRLECEEPLDARLVFWDGSGLTTTEGR